MNPEKDTLVQIKRLSNETDYFNNVFKKTEKVISVIFYILSHIGTTRSVETHVSLIKDRALKTHEVALSTLRLQAGEVKEGVRTLLYALVDLESTLRIAQASGAIPEHISQLIFEQIVGVERYLEHHYLSDDIITFDENYLPDTKKSLRPAATKQKSTPSVGSRRRNVQIPAGDISSDAYFVYSQLTDRADRIRTVLEAKPQATIRDIAEIITDVSEKTIQRELNSLIEKGQVIREGERRWSRYSAKK